MTETTQTESKKEKKLKFLGDLFGYLAIILGLLIPFFLEEIKKEDITLEEQSYILLFLEVIFLLLIGICSFYYFRYLGKDLTAEKIGLMVLGLLYLIVPMLHYPILDNLFSVWDSTIKAGNFLLFSFVTTAITFMIILMGIGITYYVSTSRRLSSLGKPRFRGFRKTKKSKD